MVCCYVTKTAHHTPTDFQPDSRPWHVFVMVCYVSVFYQLAFWLDIALFHMIICRSYMRLSSGFPQTAGFLIVNIQHVYVECRRAPPTFFRADSVTLNTPHTTGKSDKIILRTTRIFGTLPGIVGRGEIGSKSARLSFGVYPALNFS